MKEHIKKHKITYILIFTVVLPIIFVIILPLLNNVINYKDSNTANLFTIVGTFIAYIGFIYTIYQLLKIKSSTDAANKAKLDTIHSINFNNTIDLSNSIINSCNKANELLRNEQFQDLENHIRELSLKIIDVNACIGIIREKKEFDDLLDFKKYVNDLKITLNDISSNSTISNLLKLNIQKQLDNILFDATQLKTIKIKIINP
jgi:hypothetical protein